MTPTPHDELIEAMTELRQALPALRFGQLLANLATVARGPDAGAVWDVEDDELLAAARWQLAQLTAPAEAP
ncbi:MAG TPA: hypothetical protein VD866_04100 [Urbifossiella sp.]|nr:hypothetical protein [Urbifossiella sp.]